MKKIMLGIMVVFCLIGCTTIQETQIISPYHEKTLVTGEKIFIRITLIAAGLTLHKYLDDKENWF